MENPMASDIKTILSTLSSKPTIGFKVQQYEALLEQFSASSEGMFSTDPDVKLFLCRQMKEDLREEELMPKILELWNVCAKHILCDIITASGMKEDCVRSAFGNSCENVELSQEILYEILTLNIRVLILENKFDGLKLLKPFENSVKVKIINEAKAFCKSLPNQTLASFIAKGLIPQIFSSDMPTYVRGPLLDLAMSANPSVSLSLLSPEEINTFRDALQTKYLQSAKSFFPAQASGSSGNSKAVDTNWHRICLFLLRFLGTTLHSDIGLINTLLVLITQAFKSQNIPYITSAYQCWQELIDNYKLNYKYLCHQRQINLLIKPLNTKLSKDPTVIWKRYEVWIYLLKALKWKGHLVLKDFLNFCFGPHSPVKAHSALYSKITNTLIAVIGHYGHNTDPSKSCTSVDDTSVLEMPVVCETKFFHIHETFIGSIVECCLLLQQWCPVDRKPKVVKCLWSSLLQLIATIEVVELKKQSLKYASEQLCNVVDNCNDNMENYDHFLIYILQLLEDSSLKLVSHNMDILQSEFLHPLFLKLLNTHLTLTDKQKEDLIKCIAKNKQSSDLEYFLQTSRLYFGEGSENATEKHLMLWTEVVSSLEKICDKKSSLSLAEELENDVLIFILWPLHCKFDKISHHTMYIEKWKKMASVVLVSSENIQLKLVKELKKHIITTPANYFGVNQMLCACLPVLENDEKYISDDFILEILETTGILVNLPFFHSKTTNLENIFDKCLSCNSRKHIIDKMGGADVIFKCLEGFIKHKESYTVLTSISKILKNMPQKIKEKIISSELKETILQLTTHEDPKVSRDALKIVSLLEDKSMEKEDIVSTPKQNMSRGAKIAGMVKNKASSPSVSAVASLFGPITKSSTPVKIKGSMLNTSPNISAGSTPTRKIISDGTPKREKSSFKLSNDDDDQFVVIDTKVKFDPKKLTERQKETIGRRRDDIPALYQDLSQSQTNMLSFDGSEKEESNSQSLIKCENRFSNRWEKIQIALKTSPTEDSKINGSDLIKSKFVVNKSPDTKQETSKHIENREAIKFKSPQYDSKSNKNEQPCIDEFITSLKKRKNVINDIRSGIQRNEISFPVDVSKTMAEHYMSIEQPTTSGSLKTCIRNKDSSSKLDDKKDAMTTNLTENDSDQSTNNLLLSATSNFKDLPSTEETFEDHIYDTSFQDMSTLYAKNVSLGDCSDNSLLEDNKESHETVTVKENVQKIDEASIEQKLENIAEKGTLIENVRSNKTRQRRISNIETKNDNSPSKITEHLKNNKIINEIIQTKTKKILENGAEPIQALAVKEQKQDSITKSSEKPSSDENKSKGESNGSATYSNESKAPFSEDIISETQLPLPAKLSRVERELKKLTMDVVGGDELTKSGFSRVTATDRSLRIRSPSRKILVSGILQRRRSQNKKVPEEESNNKLEDSNKSLSLPKAQIADKLITTKDKEDNPVIQNVKPTNTPILEFNKNEVMTPKVQKRRICKSIGTNIDKSTESIISGIDAHKSPISLDENINELKNEQPKTNLQQKRPRRSSSKMRDYDKINQEEKAIEKKDILVTKEESAKTDTVSTPKRGKKSKFVVQNSPSANKNTLKDFVTILPRENSEFTIVAPGSTQQKSGKRTSIPSTKETNSVSMEKEADREEEDLNIQETPSTAKTPILIDDTTPLKGIHSSKISETIQSCNETKSTTDVSTTNQEVVLDNQFSTNSKPKIRRRKSVSTKTSTAKPERLVTNVENHIHVKDQSVVNAPRRGRRSVVKIEEKTPESSFSIDDTSPDKPIVKEETLSNIQNNLWEGRIPLETEKNAKQEKSKVLKKGKTRNSKSPKQSAKSESAEKGKELTELVALDTKKKERRKSTRNTPMNNSLKNKDSPTKILRTESKITVETTVLAEPSSSDMHKVRPLRSSTNENLMLTPSDAEKTTPKQTCENTGSSGKRSRKRKSSENEDKLVSVTKFLFKSASENEIDTSNSVADKISLDICESDPRCKVNINVFCENANTEFKKPIAVQNDKNKKDVVSGSSEMFVDSEDIISSSQGIMEDDDIIESSQDSFQVTSKSHLLQKSYVSLKRPRRKQSVDTTENIKDTDVETKQCSTVNLPDIKYHDKQESEPSNETSLNDEILKNNKTATVSERTQETNLVGDETEDLHSLDTESIIDSEKMSDSDQILLRRKQSLCEIETQSVLEEDISSVSVPVCDEISKSSDELETNFIESPIKTNSVQPLPASPITGDTPNRNAELVSSTIDISPIKNMITPINLFANDCDNEDAETESLSTTNTGMFESNWKPNIQESDFECTANTFEESKSKKQMSKEKSSIVSSRSAKLLNLIPSAPTISANKSPKQSLKGKTSAVVTTVSSPQTNRIKKMMMNVVPEEKVKPLIYPVNNVDTESGSNLIETHLEGNFSDDLLEKEEVLTFSRDLPKASDTPRGSILKRKAPDSRDDGFSPCPKRKRVNFSDPPTSCKKIYFKDPEENTDENTPNKISKKKAKLSIVNITNSIVENKAETEDLVCSTEATSVIKEKSLIEDNAKGDGNTYKKPEENMVDLDDDIILINTPEDSLLNLKEKKEEKKTISCFSKSPSNKTFKVVYSDLLGCTTNIQVILHQITRSEMDKNKLLKEFELHNINTIGDLAALEEMDLLHYTMKLPKLFHVRNALRKFKMKMENGEPEFLPTVSKQTNIDSSFVDSEEQPVEIITSPVVDKNNIISCSPDASKVETSKRSPKINILSIVNLHAETPSSTAATISNEDSNKDNDDPKQQLKRLISEHTIEELSDVLNKVLTDEEKLHIIKNLMPTHNSDSLVEKDDSS